MGAKDYLRKFNPKKLFKSKGNGSAASFPADDPSSLAVAVPTETSQPTDANHSSEAGIGDPLPPEVKSRLQEELWNEAYDKLRDTDHDNFVKYEEILLSELRKEHPHVDSISNGGSYEERWRHMQRLVEIGLKKTETEAKVYEKVNDGLELFGTVRAMVEPAVQAVPQAAIPWVGVCFILQVISNPAKQPGIHREGLQYVLSRVDWYWNMAELLLEDNVERKEGVERTPLSNLQLKLKEGILDLYQKFLSYLIESVRYFHKNRANAFLKSVVDLDHWSSKISDIKAAEEDFEKSSEQFNSQASRERLNSLIITVQNIETALERQTKQQLKLHEDESNKACLQALYTTNPLDDKKRIEDGLISNCYSWVFLTEKFQLWQEDPDRKLLWIKGDPGKGKTMLLCGIVDRLDELTPNLITCFFCQATESHHDNATAVLRGLIWSLVCQHPRLVSHIRNRFDSAGEKAFTGSNTWHVLSDIFRNMIFDRSNRVPDGTTIAIDALDECTHDKQKLLSLIVEYCADENAQIRWMVTSRNWVEIEDTFLHGPIASKRVVVPLENNEEIEKCIKKAVHAFTQFKVGELARKKRWSFDDEVYELFTEKSGDTFLWVALAYKYLLDNEIETWQLLGKLRDLPSGLQKLYKRMMQDVERSSHQSRCKDILAVAALVHRPISLSELACSAKSLSRFSNDIESLRRLVLRCGCFLVVTENIVFFMHQSAKDYLLEDEFAKKCIWEVKSDCLQSEEVTRSHRTIFLTIVGSLKHTLKHDIYDLKDPDASITDLHPRPGIDPLASVRYACIYWADHIILFDEETACATLKFLEERFLYWLEVCCLLGKVPTAALAIQKLQKFALDKEYHELADFLRDANRFILYFKSAIAQFPLQIYTSGLIFSPKNSLTRKAFEKHSLRTLWLPFPIQDDWNACVQTLEGHTDPITHVTFSSDGRWLVSLYYDNTGRIWDVATGVCVQTLDKWITAVAFSIDGSCFASGLGDNKIRLWETTTGKFKQTRNIDTDAFIIGLVFSPDGEWLASWPNHLNVEMRNARTGDCIYRIALDELVRSQLHFEDDHGRILRDFSFDSRDTPVVFSSDGQYILLGSEYPGIWNVKGRSWAQPLDAIPGRVLTQAFSPGGNWIGHAYDTRGHSIWSISKEKCAPTLEFLSEDGFLLNDEPPPQRPSAISADCKQIATCTESPFQLVIVDVETGALAFLDPQIQRGLWNELPESMAWSADNQWLAMGSPEGQIKIWDPKAIRNGSKTHETHTNMYAMAFTADGQRFACGLENGIVKIQSVAHPGIYSHILEGHCSPVYAAVFSPNGNMLATQCASLIKIWNIETTGQCLRTIPAGQNEMSRIRENICLWAMVFSADNSQFAFTQAEYAIEVHDLTEQGMYELETGEPMSEISEIWSLTFSPDGLSLVAGGNDSTILVWNLRAKGAPERRFESWGSSLAITFSDDGKLLAHATWQWSIFIWQMPEGQCILKLDTEWKIRQLSFSLDGKSLITEYGRLVPEYWPSDIDMQTGPEAVPFTVQGYGVDEAWLTKNGERFVWLPPEYRENFGYDKNVLVADSVVAIRNSSHQLSMYYFDHK